MLTDTVGRVVNPLVHVASLQDREDAPDLLRGVRHSFPWLRHVFADGSYAGDKLAQYLPDLGDWTFENVHRSNNNAEGFEVGLPLGRRAHVDLAQR